MIINKIVILKELIVILYFIQEKKSLKIKLSNKYIINNKWNAKANIICALLIIG